MEVRKHDVVVNAAKMHAVDITGVVLRYNRLRSAVECSFPGSHTPHLSGLIATARCGVLLRIGNYCANKHVSGWDALKEKMIELAKRDRIFSHVVEARGTFERTKARARAIPTQFKSKQVVEDIGRRLLSLDELEQKIDSAATAPGRTDDAKARAVAAFSNDLKEQEQELLAILARAENAMVLTSLEAERARKEAQLDHQVRDIFEEAKRIP
ncbi:MAG: hypothetical protein ABW061_17920 [Polyangiaceae bacterium]